MKKLIILFLLLLALSTNAISAQIAEYAVSVMKSKDYPKLYATYGDAGFAKINKLAPLVAQKAASSPECDRVEIVEMSSNRSTQSSIVFFVDCKNGKRFYISESEVSSGEIVKSQTEKMSAYTDKQAVDNCETSIKAQLKNPDTYNRKVTTTSVYRAPSNGNIVVTYGFTAVNYLGSELPQRAKCVITEKGVEDAVIIK